MRLSSLPGSIRERYRDLFRLRDTYDPMGYREAPSGSPVPAMLRANEATHTCLRGPCVHFIQVRQPTHAQSIPGRFATSLIFGCALMGPLGDPLAGKDLHIYCTQWWPSQLALIPEFARPFVREAARQLYERVLVLQGYTFEWRQAIPRWVQDHPDERRQPYTTEVGRPSRRSNLAGVTR